MGSIDRDMEAPRLGSFAFAGLAWGCLAWLVGFRALEPAAVGGVVASPLIGLAVGAIVQRQRAAWGGQVVLALASLYLGATLFALVLGSVDALVSDSSGPLGMVWDNTTGVWYGTTHFRLASPNVWWRKR